MFPEVHEKKISYQIFTQRNIIVSMKAEKQFTHNQVHCMLVIIMLKGVQISSGTQTQLIHQTNRHVEVH